MDNLLPNFRYKLQLQGPITFDDMIKQGVHIEELRIKKGELTL